MASTPTVKRRSRAVILVNLGTPNAADPAAVREYLQEFLSDPLVIQLPPWARWLQRPLGMMISRMRAKHSAEKYEQIWTDRGSPLRAIMQDLSAALEKSLPRDWQVFAAMRYGGPKMADTLARIEELGINEAVVVNLYPQYSVTTTGTVLKELYRTLRTTAGQLNITTRATWYDDVGYINAQARVIAEYASANDLDPRETHLLYSAHSLPVSYVCAGDPYERHITRTAALVTERLGWPANRTSISFQSRMGPAKWLQPETHTHLAELHKNRESRILVCPISFPVDCLETIEEIGIRYSKEVSDRGGRLFLCPALNTSEHFVSALRSLVLYGHRPMTSWGEAYQPLLTPSSSISSQGSINRLVMIGVSQDNGLRSGSGPALRYSSPAGIKGIKRNHEQTREQLRTLAEENLIQEGLILNTCHRLELYGWLSDDYADDVQEASSHVQNVLFSDELEGLEVNSLSGYCAWHHLLRTVCGLNSGLPGDTDVANQFETAQRIADKVGTWHRGLDRIEEEIKRLNDDLCNHTSWHRETTGYCSAALARVLERHEVDLQTAKFLIIGGSATSRSLVCALYKRFSVGSHNVTLVYRGHTGGQMKLLRKAIGSGTRVRVQSYDEAVVKRLIADADVVLFGIDHCTPVLDMRELSDIRDFAARPLVVLDFNTLGSVKLAALSGASVYEAAALEAEACSYAEALKDNPSFLEALMRTEKIIQEQVSGMFRCVQSTEGHCLQEATVPMQMDGSTLAGKPRLESE